jgi:hypothetical protein
MSRLVRPALGTQKMKFLQSQQWDVTLLICISRRAAANQPL